MTDLSAPPFATRHIGPNADEQQRMLEAVGFETVADLVAVAVPEGIRAKDRLKLPAAASETEAIAELRALADRNQVATSMIGLGYYDTITPAVIRRNLLENPGWYTAYTPYQPEISQGRLEALLNFQTVVSDLTGLPVAGASLLDEGTAAAEAMTLARRAGKSKSDVFVVDTDVLPQTRAVLETRAEPLGIELRFADLDGELPECYGVLVQYPGASGRVRDFRGL
ncbi:MAG: glycine dehydrogenase (aminomethyl-transferring), partial [Nonomuraea sp.]|nr:glycine dehydrogenase (aminomethyl-transferring) [Nonomuraea sp.]